MDLFENIPDLPAAQEQRDAGMALVADNAGLWWHRACIAVAQLREWSGTGEDLRLVLVPVVGEPHSPNAWGALISHAIRQEWLSRTGERRPMRTIRSHARRTDVYRTVEKNGE